MLRDLRETDHGDGMSTGTGGIHERCLDGSVTLSLVHDLLDLIVTGNGMLRETLDVDTECLTLTNLETILATLFGIADQILHLLVVNLANLSLDLIGKFRVLVSSNTFENLGTGERNDTSVSTVTSHRVRLSGTGLTVSKETHVETFPG